jgi:hypothetical protein
VSGGVTLLDGDGARAVILGGVNPGKRLRVEHISAYGEVLVPGQPLVYFQLVSHEDGGRNIWVPFGPGTVLANGSTAFVASQAVTAYYNAGTLEVEVRRGGPGNGTATVGFTVTGYLEDLP